MKQYKDEVVHFSGGLNDYVGMLEIMSVEAGGGRWCRIHEPCLLFQMKSPTTRQLQNVLTYMCGAPKNYHPYVDIFIPRDSIIEVRVLDKKGQMFDVYKREISRKAPNLIVVPDMGIAAGPN